MLGGHFLHGGDYNPEQWLDCPEILEEDIRLMKKARVNCVTLGVFSWAVLEPEEGRYDFDWLEEIDHRTGERSFAAWTVCEGNENISSRAGGNSSGNDCKRAD